MHTNQTVQFVRAKVSAKIGAVDVAVATAVAIVIVVATVAIVVRSGGLVPGTI